MPERSVPVEGLSAELDKLIEMAHQLFRESARLRGPG
jgi:hypothetical protein